MPAGYRLNGTAENSRTRRNLCSSQRFSLVPPSDVSKCSTLREQSLDLFDHLVGASESSKLAAILARTPRSYRRACGSQVRIDNWLINAVQDGKTHDGVLGVYAD